MCVSRRLENEIFVFILIFAGGIIAVTCICKIKEFFVNKTGDACLGYKLNFYFNSFGLSAKVCQILCMLIHEAHFRFVKELVFLRINC